MSTVVNTQQAELWNGPGGRHWAEFNDGYDTMAEGSNPHLMEAAGLTEVSRVLDVGCGTGRTTRLAAAIARRGQVTGVDLSEPMLDRARKLAGVEGLDNIEFVHGDAQVHPFPAGRFDVAISRAGVMFFADPVAAFANIGASLVPGGRMVFMTQRRVSEGFERIYEAVAEEVEPPEDPGTPTPGVVMFADSEWVGLVLDKAGFEGFVATPVEFECVLGSDACEVTDFLLEGPLSAMVGHADAASRDRARDAVRKLMEARAVDGRISQPAYYWLYSASKPDS